MEQVIHFHETVLKDLTITDSSDFLFSVSLLIYSSFLFSGAVATSDIMVGRMRNGRITVYSEVRSM
jgi:hypothetical protein